MGEIMRSVLKVGLATQYTVRIDFDEFIFEIYDSDHTLVGKYQFTDSFDIINNLEQYTILTQDDIDNIIEVCEQYGIY